MIDINVELLPKAAQYLKSMNQPDKGRVMRALDKLGQEPPQGDIRSLTGKDGYRLRVGSYRVLFDVMESSIVVYSIAPRGQSYKGGF